MPGPYGTIHLHPYVDANGRLPDGLAVVKAVLLVLVLEVGHSLIPSSRTRNSSGSKRSTKRVNIATIRTSSSLPGRIRSLFANRLATEASKHAAHSKAEERRFATAFS